MFNEKQRFSLRKLSVGLASVCIGLSFVNMTSKEVKADTVSAQTSAIETKTNTNNKADTNADASKKVAKSTNSVDSNKISPSQTVLNKQATSNDLLKGTDVKQGIQETSAKHSSIQAQPAVSNKYTNIKINNNLNKHTIKQALETSLLKDTTKPETTNTLSGQASKFVAANTLNEQKTARVAEPEAVKSDLQIYHNVRSDNDYNSAHEFDKNQTYQFKDGRNYMYGPLSVHGSFTIDGSSIVKGNHIHIGSIESKVNRDDQTSAIAISAQTNLQPDVTDKNGNKIGHIFSWSQTNDAANNHKVDFYIDVTTDKQYVGQMSFNWALPNSIIVDRDTDLKNWMKAKTSEQNPYVDTITTSGNHKYVLNIQNPRFSHRNKVTIGLTRMNAWARGDVGYTSSGDIGFSHDQPNLEKLSTGDYLYDLSKNTSDQINYTDGSFKRVLHLVGSNVPIDYKQFGTSGPICNTRVFDENGKFVDSVDINYSLDRKNSHGTYPYYFDNVGLADNLTPDQVIEKTPLHSVGFSKQSDGSWYIAWNLDKSDTSATTAEIADGVKSSRYYNFQTDPNVQQKIMDNTLKINKDIFHNTSSMYMLRVFQPQPNGLNNDFSITDVTPNAEYNAGSSSQAMATPTPTKTSEGFIKRSVSYQFVDDDEHSNVVGSIITKTGKTGDIVNPDMHVPTNYSLAKNQTLPGNYTLKDNNNMIQVHLVHQKSSAPDIVGNGTRIINFDFPASYKGNHPNHINQTITFKEHGYFDKVLNKNIYSDWQAEGPTLFDKVNLPNIDGYTTQVYGNDVSVIPVATAVPKEKPDVINVTFKADPQKMQVKFVDDDNNDKQLGDTITVNGVTDGQADFKDVINAYKPLSAKYYILADGQTDPSDLNHTFTAYDSTTYTVHVKHATQDVTRSDPNAETTREYRVIERRPAQYGGSKTIIDLIEHYHKQATKDLVTGVTTYGKYVITKRSFDKKVGKARSAGDDYFFQIPLDQIMGYTTSSINAPSNEKDAYNYPVLNCFTYTVNGVPTITLDIGTSGHDADSNNVFDAVPASRDYYIDYTPNTQTSSYTFVDDDANDKQVGNSVMITGKTDQTVNLSYTAPKNYVLVSNQPTTYSFKNIKQANNTYKTNTVPITIHLKHKHQDVTMSDPKAETTAEYRVIERRPTQYGGKLFMHIKLQIKI